MENIRVLVVDDSAFMRKMISELLNSDQSINVIGTARNGHDAIAKIKSLSPDVVTLDVEMPVMDGLKALQIIMKECPLPVVMVSSLTQAGADLTIQSLQYGAVDFIAKPSGSISLDIMKLQHEMIAKLKYASLAKVRDSHPDLLDSTHAKAFPTRKTIVAIGVSTGGPRALQHLFTCLPKDFPAPIVVVQHMPARFTKSLAERLNKIATINIKEAEQGEVLEKGTVYIAPGDNHLSIDKVGNSLIANTTQTNSKKGHRPSADVLFRSIAQLSDYRKYALVLTGMGSDGSNGIKALKQSDQNTIVMAESEESSIIFGMPKSAIETKCVDHVVSIDKMGQALCERMQR
ncbi:protein-glutamate methylesterase/protein-glutamine glutaminase [Salinibacillus xinjiangensis]|uniref:Protein-glutamate methylesterase/protein-glutamine glutaminase n=1 Tax=Salinibacillus xinjiangensis TaxID=1229268 RepID=A0A6G1X3A9_9BACI|nr:chemotaxis response regulator protein-glutamate methylesterase [Salinibacillus xinjiangensis]MRG85380.1 chemotaxis-specific protein-glutamate methyltransferase CheB [Salinibacillus xinjiangensis]